MIEPSRPRVRPLVNSAFVLTSRVVPSASANSSTRLPGMSLNLNTPRAGTQAGPSVQVNPSATFSRWVSAISRWSMVMVFPFTRWGARCAKTSGRRRGIGHVLTCHLHGLGDPGQRVETDQADGSQDHVCASEAGWRDAVVV